MAHFAYFADLPDGTSHEWRDRSERYDIGNGRTRVREIGAKVRHEGGRRFSGYIEGAGWIPVTRKVELKASPSRHACNAACLNASGKVMRCECACAGRNHGKGGFQCA